MAACLPAVTVFPARFVCFQSSFRHRLAFIQTEMKMRPSLPTFHKHHNYVPERKSTALIGDKSARWLIWSTLPLSSLLDFMFLFFIASTKGGWMSLIFFSCYFNLFCVPVWRSGVLIGTAALVWWLHTTVCVTCDLSRVYSCLFLRICKNTVLASLVVGAGILLPHSVSVCSDSTYT